MATNEDKIAIFLLVILAIYLITATALSLSSDSKKRRVGRTMWLLIIVICGPPVIYMNR